MDWDGVDIFSKKIGSTVAMGGNGKTVVSKTVHIGPRVIAFTGKGGTGKTTNACACAVALADMGYKVLLMSTDPAHSVSDSLDQKMGNEAKLVKGFNNFWAIEIDGNHEYEKLKGYFNERNLMADFFGDVADKMGSQLPGMSELASLFKIFQFVYDINYDVVVVDTAPTGHTLQLFYLPQGLNDILIGVQKAISTWDKFKGLFSNATSRRRVGDWTVSVGECVDGLKLLFQDKDMTFFYLVSEVEYMSLAETVRASKDFTKLGIIPQSFILNKIQPSDGSCSFCSSRRDKQNGYIERMLGKYKDKSILRVPLQESEVFGIDGLRKVSKIYRKLLRGKCTKSVVRSGFDICTNLPYPIGDKYSIDVREGKIFLYIDYELHEGILNVIDLPDFKFYDISGENVNGRLVLKFI